jgi:hypothetical protein
MKKRVRKGQHERPVVRLEWTLLEFREEVRSAFASIREEFIAVRREIREGTPKRARSSWLSSRAFGTISG